MQDQAKSTLQDLIEILPQRPGTLTCSGLDGSQRAYLLYRLAMAAGSNLCCITADAKSARQLVEDLRFFMSDTDRPVDHLPPYNVSPFRLAAVHNDTAAARIRCLYGTVTSRVPTVRVVPVEAMLQAVVPKAELLDYAELLITGEEIERDALVSKLIAGGYARVAIVEEPGDFSLRGGILDIFTPLYPEPLRIEWFGDTVDDMRFFSPATQRKTGTLNEAVILPARETVLRKERLAGIVERIHGYATRLGVPVTRSRRIIAAIRNESGQSGAEMLLPLVYDPPGSLFDYLAEDTLFVLDDPAGIIEAGRAVHRQAEAHYRTALEEKRLCAAPEALYLDLDEALARIDAAKPIRLAPFPTLDLGRDTAGETPVHLAFDVKDTGDLRLQLEKRQSDSRLFQPVASWGQHYRERGFDVCMVCPSRSQGQKIHALLDDYGIASTFQEGFPGTDRDHGRILICDGEVSGGFIWPTEGIAVVSAQEIFGGQRQRRQRDRRTLPTELLTFEDLKIGDLVVHVEHGIGRYEGLRKLRLDGATNDFLLICYQDDDKLYLPVDRMNMIQKYMGIDDMAPALDKMGGKSWERIKDKVKRSVERIAGELLKLYAARKVRGGHAFSQPDSYFREFEAGFAYEETPDQIRAINDVVDDMTGSTPMDRLVCGDVGYGKTEVALRASFFAVNDGRQVALLVPTTVLALQHFETFKNRFSRFPVSVACLSRIQTPAQQRRILEEAAEGKIDIVIGTHRLLQKDVAFKSLGLVIIDEEHRFGVRHKEKLKKLRETVDVLALTATPIPRTLHLSLVGVRDISVILTPPEQRRAIVTYVSEYDEAVVQDAIRKELARDGQIFFVHNNIHGIHAMGERIRELVPEVRLGIAHGRMEARELEAAMVAFSDREIDLLLCTTIIESGLDIPSANTMIINRADRFGLAQIYQLRGRVGRSDEQAFAYLFIPSETALTRDAQKRLKVLMEHSDLGAGFQIAMNDLKIRGGGTILGASQSGHIAAVGYDMFLKLMETAVAELKGEPIRDPLEPEIHLPMSAHIPESYIPDIDLRLSAYRQLVRMESLKEIADFKAELVDRYGPLPEPAANLLMKIMLRVLCIQAGVKRLDLKDTLLQLGFSELHQQNPSGVVDLIMNAPKRYRLTPDNTLRVGLDAKGIPRQLAEVKNILKEIIQRVTS